MVCHALSGARLVSSMVHPSGNTAGAFAVHKTNVKPGRHVAEKKSTKAQSADWGFS
jgi:hypothetical protein